MWRPTSGLPNDHTHRSPAPYWNWAGHRTPRRPHWRATSLQCEETKMIDARSIVRAMRSATSYMNNVTKSDKAGLQLWGIRFRRFLFLQVNIGLVDWKILAVSFQIPTILDSILISLDNAVKVNRSEEHSDLNMEAVRSSERCVTTHKFTRHYNPKINIDIFNAVRTLIS
jgi:hypothetical protein